MMHCVGRGTGGTPEANRGSSHWETCCFTMRMISHDVLMSHAYIQKDTDLDYADYAGGCSFCCVVVFCPGIYTKNRFQWGRCCRVDGSDALQTDQHFIFSSCLVSHHDNIREHTYACTAPHSVLTSSHIP